MIEKPSAKQPNDAPAKKVSRTLEAARKHKGDVKVNDFSLFER